MVETADTVDMVDMATDPKTIPPAVFNNGWEVKTPKKAKTKAKPRCKKPRCKIFIFDESKIPGNHGNYIVLSGYASTIDRGCLQHQSVYPTGNIKFCVFSVCPHGSKTLH